MATTKTTTVPTRATAKSAAETATLGLPAGSLGFFRDLAEDAGNWGGNPWFDGNVAVGRSAAGYVRRLVQAGLIESHDDDGHAYAVFTDAGIDAAGKLGIDLTWIRGSVAAARPATPTEADVIAKAVRRRGPAKTGNTATDRKVNAIKSAGRGAKADDGRAAVNLGDFPAGRSRAERRAVGARYVRAMLRRAGFETRAVTPTWIASIGGTEAFAAIAIRTDGDLVAARALFAEASCPFEVVYETGLRYFINWKPGQP
jgi:hypothetical protein